jgi:hypothetical protein
MTSRFPADAVRQLQWLGCAVLSFVICFNLKIPEIRTAIRAKENAPEEGAPGFALPRN